MIKIKKVRVTKFMHVMDFCHYIYSYVSKTRKPAIGQFNDVRIIMIPDDDWGSDEVVNLNHMPAPIRYENEKNIVTESKE